MKRQLLIIGIALYLGGCDPYDGRLTFVNRSSDTIFYSTSTESKFVGSSPLVFDSLKGEILWGESYLVLPDSTYRNFQLGRKGWESFIDKECNESTLRVFFFKKELIMNNSWDSILTKQMYSKKYELTVKELKKINWQVTYP